MADRRDGVLRLVERRELGLEAVLGKGHGSMSSRTMDAAAEGRLARDQANNQSLVAMQRGAAQTGDA